METLKLDIVTPEGKIFSNDVKSVTLPGSEGEFGVLPGHIGIVTTLNSGVIEIEKKDGKREIVAINWGYAKVDETSVDVLAEGAVDINGDSESEIAQAIANAKKLLEDSTDNKVAVSMVVSRIENSAKSILGIFFPSAAIMESQQYLFLYGFLCILFLWYGFFCIAIFVYLY